jgi:hypothetical protein
MAILSGPYTGMLPANQVPARLRVGAVREDAGAGSVGVRAQHPAHRYVPPPAAARAAKALPLRSAASSVIWWP